MIVGMTESGKTTLAKKLAAEYKASGYGVRVYDPLSDDGWNADFQTADERQFLQAYFQSKNCRVFVDECHEVAGNHDKIIHATATRGRHYGHRNFYIAQRPTMIAVNIRSQCKHIYTFFQSPEECKVMAREFGNQDLKQACELSEGEYLYCTPHTSQHGKVF